MDVLLEKSLANCHCYGLDSIVLKDAPGMIRIFIARPEHVLYRNDPHRPEHSLSIALHEHHCDVTLMPLAGIAYNVSLIPRLSGRHRQFSRFVYESPITGTSGKGSFKRHCSPPFRGELIASMLTSPLSLSAEESHTVFVRRNRTAAWMVWEGAENPDYDPIVYSDDNLECFDFSTLNQPMTPERLREDLAILGVK